MLIASNSTLSHVGILKMYIKLTYYNDDGGFVILC